MLESKISAQRSEASADQVGGSSNSVERINVQIAQVSSSTSEARFLDLRVTVRGESSMLDLVIRLLEFLKQQRNVSLLSVESNTTVLESIPVHGVMLRLKIEVWILSLKIYAYSQHGFDTLGNGYCMCGVILFFLIPSYT